MKAVHFGAGNIGRGFIGAVLQDAGFFVTFADVNQSILDSLLTAGSYEITHLDQEAKTTSYKDFTALNSVTQVQELIRAISEADVVTASVGAGVLPRLAATIFAGIQARTNSVPLVVMACENAINATDILEKAIEALGSIENRAVYCNTAVDRIVPKQVPGSEPNVSVEPFCEWVIDNTNLRGISLSNPGATFVSDLMPFIERKLFTVNTGHLTVAYLGQLSGCTTISESLAMPEVLQFTRRVLEETSKALILKHSFDQDKHAQYVEKTLSRLSNPAIDDDVERVGRQPLRKLSRHERLIGPAAFLAEHGQIPVNLLGVVGAALRFESESDPEVATLQSLLERLSPEDLVLEVCGIEKHHPLFENLTQVFTHYGDKYSLPELTQ